MWIRHDTMARMGQSHLAGKSPAPVWLTITLLLRLFISSSTRISHHLWSHFYPGVKETMVLPASCPKLNKRLCAPFSLIITVNRVAVCSPTSHFLPRTHTQTHFPGYQVFLSVWSVFGLICVGALICAACSDSRPQGLSSKPANNGQQCVLNAG